MVRPLHQNRPVLLASTRKSDRSKLPQPTSECFVMWRSYFRRAYACGHRDSRRFQISAYGMESVKIKNAEQCADCFIKHVKKHTIFCALCGLPIMEGDGVALYDADNDCIRPEAHRIGNSVIGCLRWDCCPSAGFYAGYWTEDGFNSLFERSVSDADEIGGG